MPTYDYVCGACKRRIEIFQPMSEAPKRKCPKCGKSKLQRQIGMGAAVLFKGSGFYQTDYRSSSYTEGAKKESAPSESKTGEGAKTAEPSKPAVESSTKSDAAPSSEKSSKSARKKPR